MKWTKYQISDVAKVITGKTPPGTDEKYFNGKTLFITPTDMGDFREITETQRTLSINVKKY
ncbi:restriction endonuclease subunit S [Methylomonas sp. 11b]|uniref:restriction endonuclease subunit S n=1 Tax=Methylomonas sp. 11b TaxID=1168169 RepID=UPI00047E0614|nr:restriction endonuclease subunit S [Methylomonas sp. 11b]